MNSNKLFYRPELDGLRAFAVIAVIIYHAELTWRGMSVIPGGFLGVDVFFVLSGYLITGIFIERSPTLLSFYKNRFDRIYPALLLMLLFSSIAAYFFLQPSDLLAFTETLKGALGFYSNYIFINEDPYVSDASKYKALIHTWSLGVEWQFYIIFPLVVIFIRNFFDQQFEQLFIFLFFISFFYYLHLIQNNSNDAFYSTPARIWELFAGGIVFLISRHLPTSKADNYLSALSLAILTYAIFFFKDINTQPEFISFTAVLGSSVFILFTRKETLIYKLATLRPSVFIGIISYSLYLYHQPVLVFFRLNFAEVNNKSFLLLFGVILLISYISYILFENPIRRSKGKSKYIIILIIFGIIVSFVNGAVNTKGYITRQPDHIKNTLLHFNENEWTKLKGMTKGTSVQDGKEIDTCAKRSPRTACSFGALPADLIIIGDSFAGVFSVSFSELAEQYSLITLHHGQCPLLTKPVWFGSDQSCWQANKLRWEFLENIETTNILVGTNFVLFDHTKKSNINWVIGEENINEKYSKKETYLDFRRAVEKLIHLGHHPIILLQPPNPNQDVKKEMQRRVVAGVVKLKKSYEGTSTISIDQEVRHALEGLDVSFIDINNKLCNIEGKCLTFNDKGGLYNSGLHLSYFGVQLFINDIIEAMRN